KAVHFRIRQMWLEARAGIEPAYTDLQSAASPLRHRASGADLRGDRAPSDFISQWQSVRFAMAAIARCGVGAARSRRYARRRRECDAVLLLQYSIASARQPPRGTKLQEPDGIHGNPNERNQRGRDARGDDRQPASHQ